MIDPYLDRYWVAQPVVSTQHIPIIERPAYAGFPEILSNEGTRGRGQADMDFRIEVDWLALRLARQWQRLRQAARARPEAGRRVPGMQRRGALME